jgi:hypothetical protein
MTELGVILAFLGPPGVRELLIIAVVAFILYGRSGVVRSVRHTRYGRILSPFLNAAQSARAPSPAPAAAKTKRRRWADRWFWLLAAMAITAVTAWVVTRLLIASPATTH